MRVQDMVGHMFNRNRPKGKSRLNGRLTTCVLASCALIVVTSLAGCASGAKSGTATPSSTPSKSALCATGSLQLIGSTAFLPIAQAAAKAYRRDCAGATINVTGGDSAYGLSGVRQAVASSAKSAGSMIAMYDGSSTDTTGLQPYPMGVLIYSMVAHAGLFPAMNISIGQLRKIFDKPGEQGIVAVGRRAGSGSHQAFDTNVLGPNPSEPDKGNCPKPAGKAVSFTSCTEDSTADLLNFVNGTSNAIGYAEMPGPQASYPKISVLSIDKVAPTPDNVANGSYKFWTIEHLYASTKPTVLARDFLDFLSHYTDPDLPSDFVPCVDAVTTLGAAC
jgi:ABC-type phosphate transport system substrate-binding protein